MAGPHKITVTVIVSGARVSVTENSNQKVEHLIREALKEAGIPHPKVDDWTLRFSDGGAAIDASQSIDEAGITNGATLFLDPDEGGGGEAVVTLGPETPEPEPAPVLVDPAVSEAKLDRQLADWRANEELYRGRGWQLLGRDGLDVDIAFSARLPAGIANDLVSIPLAVRLNFQNYDVWAPSLRVIDPIDRRWLELPRVRAIDFSDVKDGAAIDLFIDHHPDTGRVFLCKVGTREYHTHFEHSGDDWLLYRDQGYGTLARTCDVLWRTAIRTVSGLHFVSRRLGTGGGPAQAETRIEIRQEDVDALNTQIQQAAPVQAQNIPLEEAPPQLLAQLPAEIRAQLPPEVQARITGAQ
jgi:hypothetical protein